MDRQTLRDWVHRHNAQGLQGLELQTALPILFERLAGLRLTGKPSYGNVYHFHGIGALRVHPA